MSALHWIAAALLVNVATVFALTTRDFVVTGLALGLGGLGLFGVLAVDAGRVRRRNLALGLIALAAGLMVVMPYARPTMLGLFRYPGITHAVGQFALLFLAVQFAIRPRFEPGEAAVLQRCWGFQEMYPIVAFVALVTAGDLTADMFVHRVIQIGAVTFAILAVLYCSVHLLLRNSAPRQYAYARIATALLIALTGGGIGFAGSDFALRYGEEIDTMLGEMIRPVQSMGSVGFSGAVTLGSVAGIKAEDQSTALRVFAETAPGYLRGAAFDTFEGRRWSSAAQGFPLSPEAVPPNAMEVRRGWTSYRVQDVLQDTEPIYAESMEVWPDSSLAGVLFHPLNVTHVALRSNDVRADVHGILAAPGAPGGEPFGLFGAAAANPEAPTDELLERLLRVPANLDPRIIELAHEVLAGAATPREAAARVERFFIMNFEYNIGIDIPYGADPMTHFLTERPAAHCEYFASGAALLLRVAGFPCRYITGFVVLEQHPFGGYWIARNAHAHAWVEAWDPETGWFIVESTPPAGVPQAESVSAWAHTMDYISATLSRVKTAVVEALREAIAAGRTVLSVVAASAVLVFVVGAAVRRWRARQRNKPARREAEAVDPLSAELAVLLKRCDEHAAQWGLCREPGETLDRFARRLEVLDTEDAATAARWYRDYATIRYAGHLNPETLHGLASNLPGTGA